MPRVKSQLFGFIGKAIGDFEMIHSGDRILVGVSGGKDSLLLCYALAEMRSRSPVKFEIHGLTVNPGEPYAFSDVDLSMIDEFLRDLGIPYHVKETSIARIVSGYPSKKTACSLCANLRRGALYKTARELGFAKVALAHHLDDAIETLLLNMFYQGSYRCFQPKTYLTRREVTVIRPMIYVSEEDILKSAGKLDLPIVPARCLVAGKTLRQSMKDLVTTLSSSIPGFRNQMRGVLRRTIWACRQDGCDDE